MQPLLLLTLWLTVVGVSLAANSTTPAPDPSSPPSPPDPSAPTPPSSAPSPAPTPAPVPDPSPPPPPLAVSALLPPTVASLINRHNSLTADSATATQSNLHRPTTSALSPNQDGVPLNDTSSQQQVDPDTSSSDSSSSSSSSSLPGFAIVLIVTAAIAAVMFIAATVVRWRRKNRNRRLQSFHVDDLDDDTTLFGARSRPDVFQRDLGRYHRKDEIMDSGIPAPKPVAQVNSVGSGNVSAYPHLTVGGGVTGAIPQMFGNDAAYHPQYTPMPSTTYSSSYPMAPSLGHAELAEPVAPPPSSMSYLHDGVGTVDYASAPHGLERSPSFSQQSPPPPPPPPHYGGY